MNPENVPAFTRAMIEETVAHECYPGASRRLRQAAQFQLPNTFRLGLFMSRAVHEGIAHRSEYLMMPYYEDRYRDWRPPREDGTAPRGSR